jgi:transposase InsO family protein
VAGPALRKQAVNYIVAHHGCSRRRACLLVRQHRSTQYYASVKDRREDLRVRMREIARTRVRYGYRRIHVLLKREGWHLGQASDVPARPLDDALAAFESRSNAGQPHLSCARRWRSRSYS